MQNTNDSYVISPIGVIHTDFKEKFGVPRQSGRAPSLLARITFYAPYKKEEAFREIERFSHLWLLFGFSATREKGWSATVRPPRLGGNTRVGVFASRSPFRPNHIGLSCVKLERIEKTAQGVELIVSGADLLDGTPIFDVKPYLPFADCIENAVGGYATAQEHYKLEVDFPSELLEKISPEKRAGLLECLADDPRPSYQEDGRVYGMTFDLFDVRFTVSDGTLSVQSVEKISTQPQT